MNPDFPRLSPGIAKIFNNAGYQVNVTEVADQLSLTVSLGSYSETRLFPYPATNWDLSVPLQAWVVQLVTNQSGV